MSSEGKGKSNGRGRAKQRRPRRPVEADYLSAVAEVVTPARWRRIVEQAACLAEQGDAKSRAEAKAILRRNGVISVNDWLR